MTPILVVASSNPGKIAEIRRLLPEGISILLAGELGIALPPETGSSFRENAEIKATVVSQASGQFAVADDSGLEVDALAGMPGVRSARYSGEGATDARNIDKLLHELAAVPDSQRSARFRCAISLAHPDGSVQTVEGACEGSIGHEPRGQCGFGYDPVFRVPGGRSFAEMTAEEKDAISHRGKALRAMAPLLRAIFSDVIESAATT